MSRTTLLLFLLTTVAAAQVPSLRGPDQRYNADLLLVVAHPDDETGGVAGYLARAIYDQHRQVAVVFVNRGKSGGNAAGAEEGNALDIHRSTRCFLPRR